MYNRIRKRWWRHFLLSLLTLSGLGLVFGFFLIFYFSHNLPSVELISTRQIAQSTKIFDRTGQVLLYEISGDQKRTVVSFEEIPQHLKDATIVIEDENFYEGPGVDWRGILRAVLVNIERGRIVQGGSTITQQLARNAFLSTEQTLTRKLKELILALQLTRHYTKDQILTFYLNEIPYGPTAYGVEAASETYFGKPVKDINLAEAAILAAIPRGPSYYSPWGSHVKELFTRKDYILERLLETNKIDKEEYERAKKTEIVFAPQGQGIKAPHFVLAVQDYLVQKYGEDLVRAGGLRVVTTLDSELQILAEKVVADGAESNDKLYGGKNAALVAEDPKTGQVLALVGSRDYFDIPNEGNFNVATQGLRQPGSALKPFAYLTAFSKGYTPDTVLFDLPTEFVANNSNCPLTVDFNQDDPICYHPENFDHTFRGPVSLRQALAQSINIPAVKVLYLVGLKDMLSTAHALGITTLNDASRYGLSLVLGGGEVKLIDLVNAYGSLAQDGVRHDSTFILEVKNSSGETLEAYKDKGEQVIDAEPVRLINDVLSDVSMRSGLFQGSLSLTVFPDHDVALKTGTSNDYRDAWTVGYIPSLVVGVWAGNNDNSAMHRQGSSILAAVPIWHNFMAGALDKFPTEAFPKPEPVTPEKPILRGEYLVGNEVHTILYSVDRRDPQGSPPTDPTRDPQFINWETPILEWAHQNLPNFGAISNNVVSSTVSLPTFQGPQLVVKEPQSGVFIKSKVPVLASIRASAALSRVRVLWNGSLVQEFAGFGGNSYELNWSFTPSKIDLQNVLALEATDERGVTDRSEIIVYK